MDPSAALSEQEVLASLPPPPSALPDYPLRSGDVDNDHSSSDATDTDVATVSNASRSKLPVSAAKASSAARSIAVAARSKLAKGGRKVLSPLGKSTSSKSPSVSSPAASEAKTSDTAAATDSLTSVASVASAAESLTSGLTSSLASASSSFSSLLFSSQGSTVSNIDDGEERVSSVDRATDEAAAIAAAEAAEVLRQVTTQQKMKFLEDLVQHRRSDWNYLKAMHEGSNYWLNVALLREQEVMNHLGDKQSIRRGAQFFYLGIGLGKLVGESTHPELLAMDCCQLLEELEFYFSSSTVQGMKMMVATSATLHEPLNKENSPEYSSDEPFRPTMHKWNQRPVYRRLITSPIPFPLDYREVLLSLCDILALIYSKLIEHSSASENMNLFQSIIRFDDRIKKLFIDPVKKEFSAVASRIMAEEMRLVRKTYASATRESEGITSTSTTPVSVAAADSDDKPQSADSPTTAPTS